MLIPIAPTVDHARLAYDPDYAEGVAHARHNLTLEAGMVPDAVPRHTILNREAYYQGLIDQGAGHASCWGPSSGFTIPVPQYGSFEVSSGEAAVLAVGLASLVALGVWAVRRRRRALDVQRGSD